MACERLCVLMTRPIMCSTSKEISTDIQISNEKINGSSNKNGIHPSKNNEFERSFLSIETKVRKLPSQRFLGSRGHTYIVRLSGGFWYSRWPQAEDCGVQTMTKIM